MITIVTAGGDELEDALSLRREMLAAVNSVPRECFDGEFMRLTAGYFTNADQTTVLAYDDTVGAVGCATVCYTALMPTYDHPAGKRAHVMNVYVREEFRRQGIARRMMEELISDARRRGVTIITLDATESGRPLYRSLGFARSEEGMVMLLTQRAD